VRTTLRSRGDSQPGRARGERDLSTRTRCIPSSRGKGHARERPRPRPGPSTLPSSRIIAARRRDGFGATVENDLWTPAESREAGPPPSPSRPPPCPFTRSRLTGGMRGSKGTRVPAEFAARAAPEKSASGSNSFSAKTGEPRPLAGGERIARVRKLAGALGAGGGRASEGRAGPVKGPARATSKLRRLGGNF